MQTPDPQHPVTPPRASGRYALEVIGKAITHLEAAQADIPPGTPINIAFLGNETHAQRVHAARVIRACGFEPVPIISSRRLRSEQDRDQLLDALTAAATPTRIILVGGDPRVPAGPYEDSLDLLRGNLLQRHAITRVGIVGYPEGHPRIEPGTLWRSLRWKLDFLQEVGCTVEITTQFGLDAEAVVHWIEQLRREGLDTPVRIGVPGPATAGTLLKYAQQFGVTPSVAVARRYGLSTDDPQRRVGPEQYWDDLRAGMSGTDLGTIGYHLYPFGGITDGAQWMNDHLPNRHQ